MSCHPISQHTQAGGTIALIGQPNVGKSALFHQLTGQRVIVSNYPGTTVEVTRSTLRDYPQTTLVDTPGVITFPPQSEDEQVTARVLLEEHLQAIVQVGDSKNIRRTLYLSLQLAEMGLPMILALNMTDEAHARGVEIKVDALAEYLQIYVVPTIAIHGHGVDQVKTAVNNARPCSFQLTYPPDIEQSIAKITELLPNTEISGRAFALLLLERDHLAENWLASRLDSETLDTVKALVSALEQNSNQNPGDSIQDTRHTWIEMILADILHQNGAGRTDFGSQLGKLSTHPIWGIAILCLILYAIYWFVGVFGAGILVDLVEEGLFNGLINPWVTGLIDRFVPFPFVIDFLVGDYGIWTMGMTYALALIMPIVSTFFLAFGLLEDSGYLPRLAALSNRIFAWLGLNGKAVLPMVLGLGCVTMATLTTRVLETRRERLLTILLLALAVPCSAQLGVIMGMLAGISLTATLIWSGVVVLVLLVVGWLAARLIPGQRSPLLVELPPIRMPVLSNVVMKTLARLEWYLKEVVPLFLIGTAVMFTIEKIGVLAWLENAGQPLITGWLGLPADASAAFLMGFMRRDFGATGLFVLSGQGLLSAGQIVVAMVTITLFIPCIATVFMIAKEAGWKRSIGVVLLVFPLAIVVGGLLYRFLAWVGWGY
jgi:ferrous iron transport protein B